MPEAGRLDIHSRGSRSGIAAQARREARAQRILDGAAALILRHGYQRTTIADIARQAAVGKGTLYLHWKARDELFDALILREKLAMAGDLRRRIASDPAGATLRGLLKHSALELMARPLLKALVLGDSQVLGQLVQRQQEGALAADVLAGFSAYLQGLRDQGLLRGDLSLQAVMVIFSSIFLGFMLAAPLLPDAFKPSDEQLAGLIAEAGHRALEPRDPGSPAAYQAASQALTSYLDRSAIKAQQQLEAGAQADLNEDQSSAPGIARARGRKGGRARKLATSDQVAEARRLYADKAKSIAEICAALGISRATLYRYVR